VLNPWPQPSVGLEDDEDEEDDDEVSSVDDSTEASGVNKLEPQPSSEGFDVEDMGSGGWKLLYCLGLGGSGGSTEDNEGGSGGFGGSGRAMLGGLGGSGSIMLIGFGGSGGSAATGGLECCTFDSTSTGGAFGNDGVLAVVVVDNPLIGAVATDAVEEEAEKEGAISEDWSGLELDGGGGDASIDLLLSDRFIPLRMGR
jgi:hypothetical protein